MVCLHTDTMGVHPACILFDGQGYSPPRPGIPPETTPPILHILPLIAHQLASARKFLASMPNWAPCSPTSQRILRNETGFDPGGQYCPKYRVQVLSRG